MSKSIQYITLYNLELINPLSATYQPTMSIYEEVEIEDMDYDEMKMTYFYPCPCGDRFRITLEDLHDGEDIAKCPSCTLRIKIIYDMDDLPVLPEDDDDEDEDSVVKEDKENSGDNDSQ